MSSNTEAARLSGQYLVLGGRRKSSADDNAISTRLWNDEPAEAREFWRQEVETLPEDKRKEVESHLPSISGDSP